MDFLTDRPQVVKVDNNTSVIIRLSTGSPQGYVLRPLLFILMTDDCCARCGSNTLIKFAHDTPVVGLISLNDESVYRVEVEQLVSLEQLE